jgi:transcription initiation factor IIE alpha subunit
MRTIIYYEDLTEHNGHEMSRQPEWYKAFKPSENCPVCGAKVMYEEKSIQVEDDKSPTVRMKSDLDKAIS